MSHYRQPPLHDLVTVLRAPSVCLSARDGQIGADVLDGFYDSDRRVLARLEAEVAGAWAVPVGRRMDGASRVAFTSQLRPEGAVNGSLLLHRRRTVRADGLAEEFELVNAGGAPVAARLLVRCATDLAPMHVVRGGEHAPLVAPEPVASGVRWADSGHEVTLTADRRPDEVRFEDGVAVLAFTLAVGPARTERLGLHVRALGSVATGDGAPAPTAERTATGGTGDRAPSGQAGGRPGGPGGGPRGAGHHSAAPAPAPGTATHPAPPHGAAHTAEAPGEPSAEAPTTTSPGPVPHPPGEAFLALPADAPPLLPGAPRGVEPPRDPLRRRLLEVSLHDLQAMLLADPRHPSDVFLAAGSPWYFTLFGRDALWSASLLLPLDTRIAAGTLRTLARRQGVRDDPRAEEQPGKILHEVRRETLRLPGMVIPPRYYGTIDATMLWAGLLHDAWRAGMDERQVEELLPQLQAALGWITRYGDADGDGFVEYRASGRGGLANQGWKDSVDAVRWADGRYAAAPLALCEVQGYAYAAAVRGADLLDAFGVAGADRWREWAAHLRARFRACFWVDDASGAYPAIALDADKRPVDGAASNMAHLLGTGLLTGEEAALVARRLARPDLDCGRGLRTLSATSRAFDPLSYHCGSVWPHDTAIAVLGLAAEGQHAVARSLAEGLLATAPRFGFRLPELFGGTAAQDGEPVLAYPTSCRPQAWAAAGAVAVLGYLEGWPAMGTPGAAVSSDRGDVDAHARA